MSASIDRSFRACGTLLQSCRASRTAEKSPKDGLVSGHGFSRAVRASLSRRRVSDRHHHQRSICHEQQNCGKEIFADGHPLKDAPHHAGTLALDDLMTPHSILLIEWGEKFARSARERDVEIKIEHKGDDERVVAIYAKPE